MKSYYITEELSGGVEILQSEVLSFEGLQQSPPSDADIFYVNGRDSRALEEVCRVLRQHSCPAIYLRPVVAVECDGSLSATSARSVDGEISHGQLNAFTLQSVKDRCRAINKAIEALPEFLSNKDRNLGLKILRFLYCRNQQISPHRSSRTIYGLHYPELELFLSTHDTSVSNMLDFLEEQRLLFGTFYEKVHGCNQCASSYLNFQEICPHCSSSNLAVDDLVHHFVCAHVAPEEDFKNGEALICPKCEKELHTIGADFDKPSAVYQCNSCRHSFQDPQIATTCFNCGAQSLPENLTLKTVQSYTLTALGENAAINGLDNLFKNILEKKIHILPLPTFKTILQVEIERLKRYKLSTSSLILFQIGNMEEVMLQLGHRTKDLFGEMSAIVKAILRTSDLTTSLNESTFITLMPETPNTGAETALQRLHEKLQSLFTTNMQINLSFRHEHFELSADDLVDECIERLLSNASLS